MAYEIDENGNITLVQGDSFELVVNGVPTDQNYKVFFAVRTADRVPVGKEIEVDSLGKSSVVIKLEGNYTRQFTVDEDKKSQKYYYGIKICSEVDNIEDTLRIGGNAIGDLNTITVYPEKVEGI